MLLTESSHYNYARNSFVEKIYEVCQKFEAADILELGGGRYPFYTHGKFPESINSYTVNDIDQSELDAGPGGYKTACFDVCGDVSKFENKYDVIISRMFAEHVADGKAMHSNCLKLLKPGGIAFHYNPKLYSLPFFANLILPEAISRAILFTFKPKTGSGERTKFPVHYSLCRGTSASMESKIQALGYSEVQVIPFYGHNYYSHIPPLQPFEKFFTSLTMKKNWSFFSTFVYTLARR